MSVSPVPASDTHGNLDEQIAQLMQYKPLAIQEVTSRPFPCLFSSDRSFDLFLLCLLDASRLRNPNGVRRGISGDPIVVVSPLLLLAQEYNASAPISSTDRLQERFEDEKDLNFASESTSLVPFLDGRDSLSHLPKLEEGGRRDLEWKALPSQLTLIQLIRLFLPFHGPYTPNLPDVECTSPSLATSVAREQLAPSTPMLTLMAPSLFRWIQDSRDHYTKERLDSVIDEKLLIF
ncbi:hypothetical protein ZIOFF_062665 [Zingiber officinale]|uniref:Uncharacterized protein n=1 Tax=Zingiber officinale TaxID=94328 RepID=A0A8J5KFJ4_ZINOF|nr:hypothetical protein ZIOFF_062665 [Zingiber officinale]